MINCMRATVTISDDLFEAADELAATWGISRSRLYQQALRFFLQRAHHEALTKQMNAHIAKHGQPLDKGFERFIAASWEQSMGDDEW